ncbi:MAG: type II toxin-antitoxin system HicB family antitoxin [Candidatus Methanoperedens sp.]|nr:type II toxin-antitoxin system HicB family antitoxin [Candidatus Methanoperedens sp.]
MVCPSSPTPLAPRAAHEHPSIAPPFAFFALFGACFDLAAKDAEGAKTDFKARMNGKIPECPGVLAFGKTLFECQNELMSVLEGWLIVKIRHGDILPMIDGFDINMGIPSGNEAVVHA